MPISTNHTGIGYKRNRIYLFVHSKCSMHAFRDYVEKLNLDGAIFLDGGGSTQMNYKGNKGIHSSRKLSHGVFLKEIFIIKKKIYLIEKRIWLNWFIAIHKLIEIDIIYGDGIHVYSKR